MSAIESSRTILVISYSDGKYLFKSQSRGNYKLYKHMPGQSYIAEKNTMDEIIPCNKHSISYIKNFMLFKVRIILLYQ